MVTNTPPSDTQPSSTPGLTKKQVVERTKQAFAGPTPKQLEQQARARAKGGLTSYGIRKFESMSPSQQKAALEKARMETYGSKVEATKLLQPAKVARDFAQAKEAERIRIGARPKTFYEELGAFQPVSPGDISTRDTTAVRLERKQAFKPIIKTSPIGKFKIKKVETKDYRPLFQGERATGKAPGISKTIDIIAEDNKQIKEIQKTLKDSGLRLETYNIGRAIYLSTDKEGFPKYIMTKPSKKTVSKELINKIKVLTDKSINKLDSDKRIRNAIKNYEISAETMPVSKALFDFSIGLLTGVGTAKVFTKLSPKLLKSLSPVLKGSGIIYSAGVPYRVYISSKKGVKGIVTEFAGDVGFFTGLKIGGIPMKTLKDTKVSQTKSKFLIKKYFGKLSKIVPSKNSVNRIYASLKTKKAKAEFIKAFSQFYKKIPKLDIQFKYKKLGKKAQAQVKVVVKGKGKKKAKLKKLLSEKELKRLAAIEEAKMKAKAIKKSEVAKEQKQPIKVIDLGKGEKKLFIDYDKLYKKGYSIEDIQKMFREANFKLKGTKNRLSDKKIRELFNFLNKKPSKIEEKALKNILPKNKQDKQSIQTLFATLNLAGKKPDYIKFDVEYQKTNNRLLNELSNQLRNEVFIELRNEQKLKQLSESQLKQLYNTKLNQKLGILSLNKLALNQLKDSLQKKKQMSALKLKIMSKQQQKQKIITKQVPQLKQQQKLKLDQKIKQIPKIKSDQRLKLNDNILQNLRKGQIRRLIEEPKKIITPKIPFALPFLLKQKIKKEVEKLKKNKKKPYFIYTPTLAGIGEKAKVVAGKFTGFETRGSIIILKQKPIKVKRHKRKSLKTKAFVRKHRRRKPRK